MKRDKTKSKVFESKKKLKGTGVSITENLTAKRMEQLNKARVKPGGPQMVESF